MMKEKESFNKKSLTTVARRVLEQLFMDTMTLKHSNGNPYKSNTTTSSMNLIDTFLKETSFLLLPSVSMMDLETVSTNALENSMMDKSTSE